MDTYEGSPEDTLSLHKYLYANSDPVNQVDPSGNVPVFGDQEFGYAVEAEVEPQYAADHLVYMTPFGPTAQRILYGKWSRLGGGFIASLANSAYRLKPDILNLSLMQWLDDKPLSKSGIPSAIASWSLYTGSLGFFGIQPDPLWVPKMQPLAVFGTPVWVINVGGILFYTDDQQKFETARRTIEVGAAVTAAWALLNLMDIVGRSLIRTAIQGTAAGLGTEVGTATMLAVEGAP